MQNKTVSIWFEWSVCRTDPSAYKKYAPEFKPQGVYVEILVPNNPTHVARISEGNIVLTLQGMAWVQAEIAKVISAKESE